MTRRLLALGLIMLFSGNLFAEQIAVKNPSFENPVLDPGGWINEWPDWDGPANAGDAFIEYIDGFNADGVNHIGIQGGEEVSQNLGIALQPNSMYELIVGVGNRNISFTPAEGNESRFGLYLGGDAGDGGSLLAEEIVDAYNIPEGTFEDYGISFTTGDTVAEGDLVISLRTTGAGRAHFDNIRLSVVPEPSTIALTLFAALGLVTRLRRR